MCPRISSGPSDHLEIDTVEESLARLGSYGNIPEVPVANSLRSVFWFAATAVGDGDATSAGNAAAGAYDNVSTYCTANLGDVCIYLAGSYDFSGAVGGLDVSIRGAKVFGLGGLTLVENTNVAATYVISIGNAQWDIEVASFKVSGGAKTVEGIFCDGDYCDIHDNLFIGAMENAIHISGSTYNKIHGNEIESSTNDGIEISGGAGSNKVWDNLVRGVGDSAISLNGNNVDYCYVYDNIINGEAGTTDYAINIALGDNNMVSGNQMVELGTWPINDTGSNNGWVNNYADVGTSSFAREAADSTNENTSDFTNIDLWTSGLFEVTLSARVVTDGTVWTFTLYEKVDTTNFEVVDVDTHTVASDVGASRVRGAFEGGDSKMQVGHQTSTQVGASRTVNLKVRCIGQ